MIAGGTVLIVRQSLVMLHRVGSCRHAASTIWGEESGGVHGRIYVGDYLAKIRRGSCSAGPIMPASR